VGEDTWEKVDKGVAGANYGWPVTENATRDPRFANPLYVYNHGRNDRNGAAITGGTFYDPPVPRFPRAYVGRYFFGDITGWIQTYDPRTGVVTGFARRLPTALDGLATDSSGNLHVLSRGNGSNTGTLLKIQFRRRCALCSAPLRKIQVERPKGPARTECSTKLRNTLRSRRRPAGTLRSKRPSESEYRVLCEVNAAHPIISDAFLQMPPRSACHGRRSNDKRVARVHSRTLLAPRPSRETHMTHQDFAACTWGQKWYREPASSEGAACSGRFRLIMRRDVVAKKTLLFNKIYRGNELF
jgi:hypothetical protein